MKAKDFERIVEDLFEDCKSTLVSKSKEYSSKNDRFHNFKFTAMLERSTSEKSLVCKMDKQLVCILDMVENCEEQKYTEEYIREKIKDSINYLALLEGLLRERYKLPISE